MSNICFSVRSAMFTMEFWLFWKFFPMNVADSIVITRNTPPIIECSSPELATLETIFCLSRTWSFTRFKNDLNSTDSNSVASFPMTKFWGLATSWELIWSNRPLSVEKNFFVIWLNFSYHSPRSYKKSPCSIVCRSLNSPLLRRPNTVIIQFWIPKMKKQKNVIIQKNWSAEKNQAKIHCKKWKLIVTAL